VKLSLERLNCRRSTGRRAAMDFRLLEGAVRNKLAKDTAPELSVVAPCHNEEATLQAYTLARA